MIDLDEIKYLKVDGESLASTGWQESRERMESKARLGRSSSRKQQTRITSYPGLIESLKLGTQMSRFNVPISTGVEALPIFQPKKLGCIWKYYFIYLLKKLLVTRCNRVGSPSSLHAKIVL